MTPITKQHNHIRRLMLVTGLVAAGLSVQGPAPANARPDPGPAVQYQQDEPVGTCPLERIGTQLIRCDFLTGAGAPAPLWLPRRD